MINSSILQSVNDDVKKSLSQGNLYCQVRLSGKMRILGFKSVLIH